MQHSLIAQTGQGLGITVLVATFTMILIWICGILFVVKHYKRCPPNRALVIYGKVGGGRAARVIHGGGVFVLPIIQDFAYLSLEPIIVESTVEDAVTRDSGRASLNATSTVAISKQETLINNAAERLLGIQVEQIKAAVSEIIEGQFLRQAAGLNAEQFAQDRSGVLDKIEQAINSDLNKIGLYSINMNVRDLTAESGTLLNTTRDAI